MPLKDTKPIEVAIVGGGCAAMATAFELTRPELEGRYRVTVYQFGWRLGGKGASGRGKADRIEEHGLHVWLGFYENAFRLLRQCYRELDRDPQTCPLADWRDAFFPDAHVGMAGAARQGGWVLWSSFFPPGKGLPGDPLTAHNPFALGSYLARTAALLRSLVLSLHTRRKFDPEQGVPLQEAEADLARAKSDKIGAVPSADRIAESVLRLLRGGLMTTAVGVIEALAVLEAILRSIGSCPRPLLLQFIETLAGNLRLQLEGWVATDDETRCKLEIIDLVVAIVVGVIRFGLLWDPRGLDAINDYECREWLRLNGASERSLNSSFVRGLYDLALAYEDGDPERPGLAAGQALRGSLRMFFTYRGSIFWKMRAGMGDVVFAPFYEVLKRRGVRFEFFHRLENVRLCDVSRLLPGERPYVEALEFDVQARIRGGGEYQPLVTVKNVPCWPAQADFDQLEDGDGLRREGWDFESHWDRRHVAKRTLEVTRDFDFVVLGVSVGAIPHVCREIVARDERWRNMTTQVKTVASQACQIWLTEEMAALGWEEPPITLSSFVKPFDTWADMTHAIAEESWPEPPPQALAYFCNVLRDPEQPPDDADTDYPRRRAAEVKANAVRFLNHEIHHLWPGAVRQPGEFRWELLADADRTHDNASPADASGFDSQYWRANVNPTDRYVLALPGTLQYRISPLDNTYDNLTIAGDWTDCGFNEGCVEAAVMSGRLAAHAIAQTPALEDIIGYDHP